MKYYKTIFDSVHGNIGLTEKEVKIINTLPFQRLHHILQLGPTYLVYPNARHSRFSHSLGVLSVMSRFASKLYECGAISQEQLRILRLSALLHDIGHYPFSHAIEKTKPKRGTKFVKHEYMAEHVIRNSDIHQLLSDDEINDIHTVITGSTDNPYFRYLLASDIDVDRTDYLLRDAHHTGVTYGGIDIHRLAESMDFDESCIVFLEKGVQAVENFLLSRYHMYQSVYYHRVVVAFDLLLTRVHQLMVDENLAYTFEKVRQLRGANWYHYNDYYLLNKLKSAMSRNDILGELAKAFVRREPLKLVLKESDDSVLNDAFQFKEFRKLSKEAKLVDIAERCKIKPEWLFYTELPIEFLETNPEKYPTMIRRKLTEDSASSLMPLYEFRPILAKMGRVELRLYTKKEYVNTVRSVLAEILNTAERR